MDEIKVFERGDLIAVVNECAIPKGFIQYENVYINKYILVILVLRAVEM